MEVKTFVRFLNNGPYFLDVLQAFPESSQEHLRQRLTSLAEDSNSYVDLMVAFYTYLDTPNKRLFLSYIEAWAIDRDSC